MKYYVRKYQYYGSYSNWKEVTREVALHKEKVLVWCDGECYAPYQVICAESVEAYENGDFYAKYKATHFE
jgi:hypothetical protein